MPEKFECDLYQYLDGEDKGRDTFHGNYLLNYSWGETTGTALLNVQRPANWTDQSEASN